MFGFQGGDLRGQGFKFALFFVAELAGFGSRRGRGWWWCGRSFCGFAAFIVKRLRALLAFGLGDRVGAFALDQPVLHAAFELAPAGIALKGDGAGDHVVQKSTVVADQKHRSVIVLQQVFEQFQRVDVEVIRRLVEHQHISRTRKQARQQQPVALATAQRTHGGIGARG